MNLVRENVGPTAVLESAWTPKHYLLDSGLLFHAQMIVHAFIALHDVILFFVALGTACCGFYRMPRVYALVSGYLARIRIGMPIDEKKYQRLVRKTRVKTVSHLQQRLLLQSYWRKKLRSALWFQFQCLLLDIVSLPFVLLTVALAPLRVPNLCRTRPELVWNSSRTHPELVSNSSRIRLDP